MDDFTHPAKIRAAQQNDFFTVAARCAFAMVIIAIPVRWRISLIERPTSLVFADFTDSFLFASDIFMLACLVCWGISLIIKPRKIRFGSNYVWVALLGLTFAAWFSLANSWHPALTTYHATRFSLLFLFFLFIVNEINSPVWVVAPIGLQVLIQSIVAIGQSLLQGDLGLQFLGEQSLNPELLGTSVLEGTGVRFLRSYGLTDHPNILGGCLAFGLLILLAAFVYQKKTFWSWIIAFVIIPASVAFLLTFSRAAWLSFLAGFTFIVIAEIKKRNFSVLKRMSFLAFACLLALLPFIYTNFVYLRARFNVQNSFSDNRVERGSITEREQLFTAGYRIFVDYPLTGIGLGVSVIAIKERNPVFNLAYQPPHFIVLLVGMETGLLGVLSYISIIVLPFFVAIKYWKQFLQSPLLLCTFAILIELMIIGLFDHYLWTLPMGRFLQWSAWGFYAASYEMEEI